MRLLSLNFAIIGSIFWLSSEVLGEVYDVQIEIRHPRRRLKLISKVHGVLHIQLKTPRYDENIQLPIG